MHIIKSLSDMLVSFYCHYNRHVHSQPSRSLDGHNSAHSHKEPRGVSELSGIHTSCSAWSCTWGYIQSKTSQSSLQLSFHLHWAKANGKAKKFLRSLLLQGSEFPRTHLETILLSLLLSHVINGPLQVLHIVRSPGFWDIIYIDKFDSSACLPSNQQNDLVFE